MEQKNVIFTSRLLERLLKETEIPEPVRRRFDTTMEQIRQKEKNEQSKLDLLLKR